jgi:predicted MFS family arabinose efflux permease
VFAAGLAVTALALLACGAASSVAALLVARGVQGVGAALALGSAPALVTLAAAGAARTRALGWYNLAIFAGGVLGPLAGGAGVAAWGWRTVYLARVPLAALALGLAWPRARREVGAPARPAPAGSSLRTLVASPRFARANAANLLANAALFAVWLLVPYYLIDLRGLAPGPAGLLFAVGALATALGAPLGGAAAAWPGARWLPAAALGLEALGLGLVARLDGGSSPAAIGLALAVGGGGLGLFTVPNMHDVMGALPPTHQGRAGSLVALMRMGGILVGARLTALVYDLRVAHRMAGPSPAAAAGGAFGDTFVAAAAVAVLAAGLSLPGPARGREGPER